MYKIDNATAVDTLPTPAAVGPNPNGYFTPGNPSIGLAATIVNADWANAVQEEICYVITQTGATLSKTNRTQLYTAILSLISSGGAYAASTSAANTYTATLPTAPESYTAGMIVYILFSNANTGAATLNLNSLGAANITRLGGASLQSGDIAANMLGVLVYDGTEFQLVCNSIYFSPSNIQNSSYIYSADGGSANTYTGTLSPAPSAYTAGQHFLIKIANKNTSSTCTLNVNSLGAKTIHLVDGRTPAVGDIQAGMDAIFMFDGTYMQLLNPAITLQIQSGTYIFAGTDSGTANAYVGALSPPIASYTTGAHYFISISHTNTSTSCTLNINSLGTKTILLADGNVPPVGSIESGMPAIFYFNGTNMILINPVTVVSGDATGSGAGDITLTLNTVNSNIGTFYEPLITVNAKGLVTAIQNKAVNNISTTTILTSSAFGAITQCTGSSAYTVTLPSHSSGKFLKISCQTTSNALITISPPSGTINGQSSLIIGSGDCVELFDDGTNYWIIDSFMQPCNCNVYSNTSQTGITTATQVKFNNKNWDVGGFFNTSTWLYTPLLPGTYQINSMITIGTGTQPIASIVIYKNGSPVQSIGILQAGSGSGGLWINDQIQFNGSSDYIGIYVSANDAISISNSQTNNNLSITRTSLF